MSRPVTEVATIVLSPGVDIENAQGAEIWQSTLKTVSSQSGFQTYRYGLHIEDKSVLTLTVGECVANTSDGLELIIMTGRLGRYLFSSEIHRLRCL
jgi:hypothetical protein